MRKIILSILLSGFIAAAADAQDRLSAQFFSAPLSYNPAATGLTNADIRAVGSYERIVNYYYDDIRTLDFSCDMPIMKGVLPKGNAIGIGVAYHSFSLLDIRSSSFRLDNDMVGLSLAYHLGLGKSGNHHLSMGAQTVYASYAQKAAVYGLPNGENVSGRGLNYNWGVMYSGALSERTSLSGGVSRYYNGMLYSRDRYTMFLGSTFTLGKNTLLFTNATYNLGDELQGSVYARFLLNNGKKSASRYDIAIYSGAVLTWVDGAFMPYIGFEAAHTRVGFSFDTRNFSNSKYPSGSYQLSIMYSGGVGKLFGKQKNNTFRCPPMY